MSPATLLPAGLLLRLFRSHFNFTVVLDDHPAGKIGNQQVRVFDVDPGEHRVRVRLLLLRRSKEIRMLLRDGEERELICSSNGMGWPTLRGVSPGEAAEIRSSLRELPPPGDPG